MDLLLEELTGYYDMGLVSLDRKLIQSCTELLDLFGSNTEESGLNCSVVGMDCSRAVRKH